MSRRLGLELLASFICACTCGDQTGVDAERAKAVSSEHALSVKPPPRQAFAACNPGGPDLAWVVYVYMAADNDLYDSAVEDFDSMSDALTVEMQTKVSVRVLFDGKKAGATQPDYDGYYQLKPQVHLANATKCDGHSGEIHSNDPEELARFLKWGQDLGSAPHQMLLIWSHGQGFDVGTDEVMRVMSLLKALLLKALLKSQYEQLFDKVMKLLSEIEGSKIKPQQIEQRITELSKLVLDSASVSNDIKRIERLARDLSYELREFAGHRRIRRAKSTIRAPLTHADDSDPPGTGQSKQMPTSTLAGVLTGKNIGVLAFDACYMGMVEAIYEFAPSTVEIVIASEDATSGWPLQEILKSLQNNDVASTNEKFARNVVEIFQNQGLHMIAALRLSQVEELAHSISLLAERLSELLANNVGKITAMRHRIKKIPILNEFYIIDLRDLIDTIERTFSEGSRIRLQAADVETKRLKVIPYHYTPTSRPNATGLAIYFSPCGDDFYHNTTYTEGQYRKPKPPSNITFVSEPILKWADFLNAYADATLGSGYCSE